MFTLIYVRKLVSAWEPNGDLNEPIKWNERLILSGGTHSRRESLFGKLLIFREEPPRISYVGRIKNTLVWTIKDQLDIESWFRMHLESIQRVLSLVTNLYDKFLSKLVELKEYTFCSVCFAEFTLYRCFFEAFEAGHAQKAPRSLSCVRISQSSARNEDEKRSRLSENVRSRVALGMEERNGNRRRLLVVRRGFHARPGKATNPNAITGDVRERAAPSSGDEDGHAEDVIGVIAASLPTRQLLFLGFAWKGREKRFVIPGVSARGARGNDFDEGRREKSL